VVPFSLSSSPVRAEEFPSSRRGIVFLFPGLKASLSRKKEELLGPLELFLSALSLGDDLPISACWNVFRTADGGSFLRRRNYGLVCRKVLLPALRFCADSDIPFYAVCERFGAAKHFPFRPAGTSFFPRPEFPFLLGGCLAPSRSPLTPKKRLRCGRFSSPSPLFFEYDEPHIITAGTFVHWK